MGHEAHVTPYILHPVYHTLCISCLVTSVPVIHQQLLRKTFFCPRTSRNHAYLILFAVYIHTRMHACSYATINSLPFSSSPPIFLFFLLPCSTGVSASSLCSDCFKWHVFFSSGHCVRKADSCSQGNIMYSAQRNYRSCTAHSGFIDHVQRTADL